MAEIVAKDEKEIFFFFLVSFSSSFVHCQPGQGSRSSCEPAYLIRGISFSSKDKGCLSWAKRSLVDKKISFSRSFGDAKEIALKDKNEISIFSLKSFKKEKEICLYRSFGDAKKISFKDEKENSFLSLKSSEKEKEISLSRSFKDAKKILLLKVCQE